jgi:signal peptidase II
LGESAPIIIIFVTAFVIGFILYYLIRRADSFERMPLAFIAGGALGNLIDRVRFGAVVDFLDFHIGGAHWPAFNVADAFICVGVALYILNWFVARRRCINANKK